MPEDLTKKKKKPASSDFISRAVDFVFDNKNIWLLILIFIIGLLLRYRAAVSVEPNADEMVHGPHALGIIDAGVIGRVWQSILWSYMTDAAYNHSCIDNSPRMW